MGYGDFSLTQVEAMFGLRSEIAPLFEAAPPAPVPDWLRDQLARGLRFPMMSEKMRGELLVMPVLLAAVEASDQPATIYSGVRMDLDAALGLVGECDFVLARSAPLPELRAPFVAVVEAKKSDIDLGIGQCAAQMVGARMFNERTGHPVQSLYGCVTTGELWQFVRLHGSDLTFDRNRYHIERTDRILGVFRAILAPEPHS